MSENIVKASQSRGIDMTTMARESRAHPSVAEGCSPVASSSSDTAKGCPGAVLGTGSNADTYYPSPEAA